MIKISSFYPFRGLLRITQEFYEDKACVKIKSLTFEREYNFEYKEITEISDSFSTNDSQMSFAFWALLAETMAVIYYRNCLDLYPVLLQGVRLLFISTLIVLIASFKKSWQIHLLDKNENLLSVIEQTKRTYDLIPQIMELIENKSSNLVELSATKPFPQDEPRFQHIEYDYTKFSKTTEKFYEDNMIGWQKGIYSEFVYQVRYDQCTDKIYRGKKTNDIMGFTMTLCGIILFPLAGLTFLFDLHILKQILYLLYTMSGLVLISIPLSFMKREMIGLLDNEGKILYWTHIDRRNKARVEEIIEFIRSKIPVKELK